MEYMRFSSDISTISRSGACFVRIQHESADLSVILCLYEDATVILSVKISFDEPECIDIAGKS